MNADIPKTANHLTIRLWLDDYPEGRCQMYDLELGDLPPAETIEGQKLRLRNLGYYRGSLDDNMNPELLRAIAAFQLDHEDTHGLESNGNADRWTLGALVEVAGG